MRRPFESRRGSALLIVLGMLAFMLFSGLAFSVFMRQTRLPTSFLRRTTITRQLSKAALAEAIEEIDVAIGNNRHPGVGSSTSFWNDRVLIGSETADPSDTVATLNLEALAYLPPSLVNEVRYWSRRAGTAKWRTLWFDSGRFAYTAVDVSDFFDVNRLVADRPRSSARRVTLAHIFEDGLDHTSLGSGAAQWDSFMANYRTVNDETGTVSWGSKVPFVSLADFNLALGSQGAGGLESPFCVYAERGQSDAGFYDCDGTGVEARRFGEMTFVTDGWYPPPATPDKTDDGLEYADLANPNNQPFDASDLLEGAKLNIAQIFQYSKRTDLWENRLRKKFFPLLGLVALYDYLDEDSIPTSLALPTAERVPMVCAMRVESGDLKLKFGYKDGELLNETGSGAPVEEGTTRTVTRSQFLQIDGSAFASSLGQRALSVAYVYPFNHQDDVTDTSYTLDGRVAFFFTPVADNQFIRTDDSGGTFAYLKSEAGASGSYKADGGVFRCAIPETSISVNADVKTEENALKTAQLRLSGFTSMPQVLAAGDDTSKSFMQVTRKWEQTREENEDGSFTEWTPADPPNEPESIVSAKCALPPVRPDGSVYSDDEVLEMVKNGAELRPNLAVWVRVRKGEDTVDLAPACLQDDDEFNTIRNYRTTFGPMLCKQFLGGAGRPLLRMDLTGGNVNLAPAGYAALGKTEPQLTVSPQTIVVSDPRYNFEPSCWFGLSDAGTDLSQLWRDNNQKSVGDGEIWMSVSDQAYLQSVWEFAFLPRLSHPDGSDNPFDNSMVGGYDAPTGFTAIPASFADTSNQDLMWRTYHSYKYGDVTDEDGFEALGLESGADALKVNPYSNNSNVLMAAFANTPVDWRMASTNNVLELEKMSVQQFNSKYAWNAYSSDSRQKLSWETLQDLATRFGDAARSLAAGGGAWRDAWNNLGWNCGSDQLVSNVDLDDGAELTLCDRKFLHGFWQDSFSVRQQLFIVFVRAEPMMMGGGVTGTAPPQLGSRAVAVVWRDPTPTKDDTCRHRTRILFYHQFE